MVAHYEPILKPNLHLSRTQARDLPSQPFPVGCIRVCLSSELAHQKACLVVGKSNLPEGDLVSNCRIPLISPTSREGSKAYLNRFIFLFSCLLSLRDM